MAAAVYILCLLTSSLCAVALLWQHRRTGARLLLWSGLCFAGLALNNLLLVLDVLVIHDVDLSIVRTVPAVVGVGVLLWGFVGDTA